MVQTTQKQFDISQILSADFITNKQPLIDYAGFNSGCEFAGVPRQTFSLTLSTSTINNIKTNVKVLYDQLIAACWQDNAVLPFDMVRFDAFLDSEDGSLQIIELNTRNVGLHEIVEWLDDLTALQLAAAQTPSLNASFVINQKKLHSALYGDNASLLYMSRPLIPKWIYFNALKSAYDNVCAVDSPDDYQLTATGINVGDTEYRAISRKSAWEADDETKALDDAGIIRILQPRNMRFFGYKDYLLEFNSPSILHSSSFRNEDINDYVNRKDELVLKKINSGGSEAVYLGPLCSDQMWRHYLLLASQKPKLWIVQQYSVPPEYEIHAHGLGTRKARTQLGIFVLPNPDSPTEFAIDIVVKAYTGEEQHFTFDPSGLHPEIWFGNVIEVKE